jgi:hypothetical protein
MINNVLEGPNPMPASFDEANLGHDNDTSEPNIEQLHTDTDEEYIVHSNEEIEESEEMDEHDYSLDEGSDAEIDMDEGDNSTSGSDVEKPQISNIVKNVKGKKFEYDDNGKIHLQRSQLFFDVNEFRDVLRDYIIQESFDILRVKNEKSKVTAICASEGCPWRIHASPAPDGVAFMIKSYEPKHTCIRRSEKTNATSTWIAKKLKGSLNADPNMSYKLMSNELSSKFGIEANHMQLYRARKKGREELEGSHADSYKKKVKYAHLLLEKNRGNIVKLNFHDGTSLEHRVFKRIFVCLAACKDGFVKGCRPFFGLDGCHLKGPYGGVLLSAVSLDANNGLFPIAFAVVEVESKDSWSFFLECLRDAIDDKCYMIMSDRQKVVFFFHLHCFDLLQPITYFDLLL